MKHEALPYQWHAVAWILETLTTPGVICADVTGLGKTLEAILVIAMMRHVSKNFTSYEKAHPSEPLLRAVDALAVCKV